MLMWKDGELPPKKALRWAMYKKHWDMVHELINYVNDNDLNEILSSGIGNKREDIIMYLLSKLGNNIHSMCLNSFFRNISIYDGRNEMLKIMIQSSVDMDILECESVMWCFNKLCNKNDMTTLSILLSINSVRTGLQKIDNNLYEKLIPILRRKKLDKIKEKILQL
jgi:hypothetical protein